VLFIRAGTLFSQRFDPLALQLEGEAVSLAEGINVDAVGTAAVSASATGSLVYRIGSANRQRQFVWFNRSGEPVGVAAAPDSASPLNPALSPAGRLVALNRSAGNADIWLLELGRGVLSRFTTGPEPEIYPVWARDGRSLVFSSGNPKRPAFNLYQKALGGGNQASPILDTSQNMISLDWSPDGRFLLYMSQDQSGKWDIGALPLETHGEAFLPTGAFS
jgi:dipeptidyl aminopeptidase/acylaminoacyl peptidase